MEATGMICAILDCDLDSVEEFNRWYDLEHLPPNISMQGVMIGRRYVATPALHALRITAPTSPLAGGRGTFVTAYTLCEPPADTVARMAELREVLYADNRMRFPADKKVVRDGGALRLVTAVPTPDLPIVDIDVPFLGHTGIVMVRRSGTAEVARWYREDWATRVAGLDGVHGVMNLAFVGSENEELSIVLVEGDVGAHTQAIRSAAPHHPEVSLIVDAPFEAIAPLDYPWVQEIVASDLPRTIG